MKPNTVSVVAVRAPVLLTALTVSAQTPLGREVTYQGRLSMGGAPLNATADFEFTLWDDPAVGSQIGLTQVVNNVTVVDGLFTAELDFGANAFLDEARWLEIRVASPSGGGLTTLSPRQPITATPFALQTRGTVEDEATGNVGIGSRRIPRVYPGQRVRGVVRVRFARIVRVVRARLKPVYGL